MARARLQLELLSDRITPSVITAVGAAAGSDPTVTVYNPDGSVRFQVQPFGADFRGGVRVAVGYVSWSSQPDVVVAAGPGGGPAVEVLSGDDGHVIKSLMAFEDTFRGGVYVAVGDVNRDGYADLVLSPDEGGGPRVRVLSGQDYQPLADFFGISDPNFRGGARTAVGDVNGDGTPDVLVAAGFGGGPRVAGFTGQSVVAGQSAPMFNDFFAFEPGLRNGAYIAVGDVNGDGYADPIFGGGPGGAPRVLGVSGWRLVNNGPGDALGIPLANFFAGDTTDRNGVRVAVAQTAAGNPVVLTAGPAGKVGSFTIDGQSSSVLTGGITGGFVAEGGFGGLGGGGGGGSDGGDGGGGDGGGGGGGGDGAGGGGGGGGGDGGGGGGDGGGGGGDGGGGGGGSTSNVPGLGVYDLIVSGTTYSGDTSFLSQFTSFTPYQIFTLAGVMVVAPTQDPFNASNNGVNARDVIFNTGNIGLGGAGVFEYATNTTLHQLFGGNDGQAAAVDVANVSVDGSAGTIEARPATNARISQLNEMFRGGGLLALPFQVLAGDIQIRFTDDGRQVSGTITLFGEGLIEAGTAALQADFRGTVRS